MKSLMQLFLGKGLRSGAEDGWDPVALVLCRILTGRHPLLCSYPFLAGQLAYTLQTQGPNMGVIASIAL